jgi:hypothetical protein
MNTQKLLDLPIRQVFDDRELLNRIVSTISNDRGLTYLESLEKFHDAVDSATVNGSPILRTALEWAQVVPEDVEASVTVLELRDGAVNRAFERAAGLLLLEQTDARGLVTLDQGAAGVTPGRLTGAVAGRGDVPLQADIGTILHDPAEGERRLARMRKAQPNAWDGEAGRARFKEHDRQMAESNVDAVRTAERPLELRRAQLAGDRVGARLDAVIATADDKRSRIRALDQEIAKLAGEREELKPQQEDRTERELSRLRLLDSDVARTGQPLMNDNSAILSTVLQGRVGEILATRPEMPYAEARRWVLEQAEPDCPLTLEQEGQEWARGHYYGISNVRRDEGGALVGDVDPAPEADETPAGLHPGSHQLANRVRERLRILDRPDSAFTATLEEMMREGGV